MWRWTSAVDRSWRSRPHTRDSSPHFLGRSAILGAHDENCKLLQFEKAPPSTRVCWYHSFVVPTHIHGKYRCAPRQVFGSLEIDLDMRSLAYFHQPGEQVTAPRASPRSLIPYSGLSLQRGPCGDVSHGPSSEACACHVRVPDLACQALIRHWPELFLNRSMRFPPPSPVNFQVAEQLLWTMPPSLSMPYLLTRR